MTNPVSTIESIRIKTEGRVDDLVPYYEKKYQPEKALAWARSIALIETGNVVVELLVLNGLTTQEEANDLMLQELIKAEAADPNEDHTGFNEIVPGINYAIQMIGPNFPTMVEERLQELYKRENKELGITS